MHPAAVATQAQQGLELFLVAALQRDHGLEQQLEILGLERGADQVGKRFGAGCDNLGRGTVDPDMAAILRARIDQCTLGRIEHCAGVAQTRVECADAETQRHRQRFAFVFEQLARGAVAQVGCHVRQRLRVALAQQHEAGVAVAGGEVVGADVRGEERADLVEQGVETGQAHAFADAPGAVELDVEQAAIGRVGGERGIEPVEHVRAQIQPSHRIARIARLRAPPQRSRAAYAIGHRRDQVLGPDRLGQEIVAAGIERLEVLFLVVFAGQEHDRRVDERFALADDRGQFHARTVGHIQVHQDQLGIELAELVERGERIGRSQRAHAGLAQDRLGEDRLRAVVLDDQHAERIGRVGVQQFGDAAHDLARLRRQRNETVRTGAHCAQAHGQLRRQGKREQGQAPAQARARSPDHFTDGIERVQKRRVDHDQVRREHRKHFLEFVDAVEQSQLVAGRLDLLVDLAGQRIAVAQVKHLALLRG